MKRISFILLIMLLFCLAPLRKAPAQANLTSANPVERPRAQVEENYWTYFPFVANSYIYNEAAVGPYMGRVLGVGQDPYNQVNLYAMTFGSGIFKSTDFGASWFPSSAGLTNLTIQSMAVDPVNHDTLYAGAYGDASRGYCGVFKSTNGGASWARTGEMANIWNAVRYNCPIVYALTVDPNNPNRVFAGTRMRELPSGSLGGGGVFRSDNGGATWTPVNSGLPSVDLYIYDLFVDKANPGVVYAALHQHGMYRSDNYGSSWYPISGDFWSGRAVAVDPFDSNTLYFGGVKKQGVWRSVNYAASWWKISPDNWDTMVGGISTDPYRPGVLFAGILADNTNYYLVRSEDRGENWSRVISSGAMNWGRMVFSPDGHTDFASVDYDGPYKSTDAGQSWSRSRQGLSGFSVTGVAIPRTAPSTVYAALYGLGVYRSNDTGASWSKSSSGLDDTNILALTIDPSNAAVLYAATDGGGVYRSRNGGGSWGALTGGYPAASTAGAAASPEPGSSPAVPAATPTPISPYENRPLPELDGLDDSSGNAAPTGQPSIGIASAATGLSAGRALAISPFNSGVVLVGTTGRGIYRLSGSTWLSSNRTTGTVFNITFDWSRSGRALAAVDASSGGVWVTTNDGQTWQAANTGLSGRTVYSLWQSPQNALIFLAGTDSGVYQSIDGGLTWTQAGLAGLAVKAVSLMPGNPGLYFAGTDTTLYTSLTGSFTWTQQDPSFNNIGIQGITQYPGGNLFYFYSRLGGIIKLDIK